METPAEMRLQLHFTIAGFVVVAATVASISVIDPEGAAVRFGMILMTIGVALWLPLPAVIVSVAAIWLGPNVGRAELGDHAFLRTETILELPGLLGLALTAMLTRGMIEHREGRWPGPAQARAAAGAIDAATGLYKEEYLVDSIERELARSRRFGHEFALMLAAIDEIRARFEYREEEKWQAGVRATAAVLLNTRAQIDQVFRFGERGFALLLPETGAKDIGGLLRRLARSAKRANPPEGQPGGPLPLHFGVTFFPQCATTANDLLRRAEVALRLAEKSPNRVQMDGAEAAEMTAPQLLRRVEAEADVKADELAGRWLGAEAPEEESSNAWPLQRRGVWGTINSNGQEKPPGEEPVGADGAIERAAATAGEIAPASDAGQGERPADSVASLMAQFDGTLELIRSLKAASRS